MAVIYYDRLYKKKGIRRQAHFLSPRVLDGSEFEFPLSSSLFWWKGNENLSFINKNISYFQKVNKGVVSSIIGYKNESEIYGKLLQRVSQPNKWIKDSQDQCKEFKFLRIGQNFKITPRILRIVNFGCVSSKYKYPTQVLKRYNVYRNIFKTVLLMLAAETSERNIFLNMDIPREIPSRIYLNKFANKLLNAHLDLLPTFEYFNVLELWKFLDPEFKESSLIYQFLPKEKWNKINLLLSVDNKVVLIRLSMLAALIKEYNIVEPGIKDKEPEMAKRILHVFLSNIVKQTPMSDSELEQLEYNLDNKKIKVVSNVEPGSSRTTVNTDDIEPDQDDREDDIDTALLETLENKGNIEEDDETIDDEDDDIIPVDMDGDLQDQEDEELKLLVGINSEEISEVDNVYENIEELYSETNSYDNVYKQLERLMANRAISKNDYNNSLDILQEIPKRKDPYRSGDTLINILDSKQDKVNITQEDITITDNPVVFDKTYNKDVIGTITKSYMENQYKKDIVRTVYSLQNGNNIIQSYDIEQSESILGGLEEHRIQIRSLTGKSSTIKLMLPKIESDGTFKISGQTYTMRSQRSDTVLRKINSTIATINSYYGKFFIEKASYKKNDIGYYLFNNISKMYMEGTVSDLVSLPIKTKDVELPLDYTHLSRYLKYFRYQDYVFTLDYDKRSDMLPDIDVSSVEKNGKYVLIGAKKGRPVVMEKDTNQLYVINGNQQETLGTIYTLLNIPRLKQPVEYCDIKIFGQKIPIVAVLGYYIGLEQLMRLLKVKYEKLEVNKRTPAEEDWYIVKFKDIKLRIKRDYGIGDLIIGGLSSMLKILPEINYKVMNTRSSFQVLWNKLGYSLAHTNEIKLMENMFIDPITLNLLETLKLPTNIKGLIIKACEILIDDNYKNPNDISQMLIKGYERVSGMMYNELIKAIREQENKSMFSKSKIIVNPYSVIQMINEDSATTLLDDLNPMSSLKQKEDVTYLGSLGRSKISMSKDTREFNSSEVGIISEATKDSSDVGITAYLTAAPNITDIRGSTAHIDVGKEGWSGLLSTSSMLAPYAITDDSKRLNFSSIMNSHVIPIKNMRAPYVRTGYEAVLPIRVSDKFCITAEEPGKVISVTKSDVTIEYINKGKTKYRMKSWTSKEEAGSCYTHYMITNLKVGDTIEKDDTILYDSFFFEPDIFNPKRVIYRQGDVITVALTEDKETFEDSAGVHKRLSDRLKTVVTKVKSIKLSKDDNIINLVKPGQKVEYTDILLTISDPIFANSKIDEQTLSILQDLKNISPKAKFKGIIEKVEIRYNCEKDEMSESLKLATEESDKRLIESFGFPGKVNGSYSIEGVPLLAGEVQIKIYISGEDRMAIGDKAIFANQLKFTVGEVFDYDIATEDGTDIDATFGLTSIMARIVCSSLNMGTTGMCLEKLEERVIEMYFGKSNKNQ